MPEKIGRKRVQELLAQGAQLLEVLPREEFDYAHLAGAVQIHLARLDEQALEELDPDRPLVVYCNDFL
jgi:rhodanese-related sulfurtransferase